MVVQRTPSSEAVLPTRRAISPRLAMRTEVMGVDWEEEEFEERRVLEKKRVRARATALDLEAGIMIRTSKNIELCS